MFIKTNEFEPIALEPNACEVFEIQAKSKTLPQSRRGRKEETFAQLTAQPNFVFAIFSAQSYRCASQRKLDRSLQLCRGMKVFSATSAALR